MGAGTTGAFAPSALLGARLATPAANSWASGDVAACGGRLVTRSAPAADHPAFFPPTSQATPSPTALYQTGWTGATTAAEPRSFTIKVLRSSGKTTEIEVDTETDLRTALRAAKVDLYTIRGKMSNCGGNASCGFCVIDVLEGAGNTNGLGMREERLLAKKPDTYRLACQTRIHGPVTVRPKP